MIAIAILTIVLASCRTAAAENQDAKPVVSTSVKQGGLICFTVTPSKLPRDMTNRPSCDALCGEHDAACSGVTNGALNPPTKCADPAPANLAVCRCCKVAR